MLTTLDNVKRYASISDASLDALIERLIVSASSRIENFCSRGLEQRTLTQQLSGRGTNRLVLDQYPITAVASLKVDGVVIPAATGSAPYTVAGYLFDERFIYSVMGRIPVGMMNVEVTWTGGYTTNNMPAEVVEACTELVALHLQERTRTGHVSKSLAGEVVSFTQKEMPDQIRVQLLPFINVIPY